MRNESVEAAASAASAGLKATVTGAAALSWGGWTSNDVAVVGGLVLGVIGLAVQVHYKRKAHRLLEAEHVMRKEEHDAHMARLA